MIGERRHGNPTQFPAQNAFNTEMNNVLAGLESEHGADGRRRPRALCGKRLCSIGLLNGSYWTNELSPDATYMTEGEFLSIAAENYTYYGGACVRIPPPARGAFDLTTGEF